MATPPKSRRPWGQYASAEDLCDPYESTFDDESPVRPTRTSTTKPSPGTSPTGRGRPFDRSPHDVKARTAHDEDVEDTFFDGEGSASRRSCRHAINLLEALEAEGGKPTPVPVASETSASGRRTTARTSSSGACANEPDTLEGSFAICAVHPSGEGDTVAVELRVPADFAEAMLGADGAVSGHQNGIYAKKTQNTTRLSHGYATVAPRSQTRSKCDFSRFSSENDHADAMSYRPCGGAEVPYSEASSSLARVSDTAPVRLKLYLLIDQYTELCPREGSITEDYAEIIVTAGKLCSAVRRGMRLLAYGDRSARRLAYLLAAKGVDREIAEDAVAYLIEKGLIQEDNSACLRAEANLRKLWGPRRIRDDLRANGYTSDAVEEAMHTLSEVNFEENCAILIQKKYRSELSSGALATDRTIRQKLTASLMRLGYDADTVRNALVAVLQNQEND